MCEIEADDTTIARTRGWAVLHALHLISIGRNGMLGRFGGNPTWGPAGRAAVERILSKGTSWLPARQ